jgi:integrase
MIIKTLAKLQHLSKSNQQAIWNRLRRLNRICCLSDSSAVEQSIYRLNVKNTTKNKLFDAYQRFCDANRIVFKKPKRLHVEEFVIHVPTESRIDRVIACCGWVYSTVFALSKYGLRPDEISKLTLRDIDLEHGKLTVPTSKLGASRVLQLKPPTIDLLRDYINRRRVVKIDSRLFASARRIKEEWRKYRARAFAKFKDTELLKIRLYDLRHWFGTTTYIRTRDIFFVKYALGHRRLDNTLVYIHLAKSLIDYPEDFACQTAKTVDEASKLIEQGFDYVCEVDGVKLFRKRK